MLFSFAQGKDDLDNVASTVAMEAIIQSEIVFVAHRFVTIFEINENFWWKIIRIRRDYEEEVKKIRKKSNELVEELQVMNMKKNDLESNQDRLNQLISEYNHKVEDVESESRLRHHRFNSRLSLSHLLIVIWKIRI